MLFPTQYLTQCRNYRSLVFLIVVAILPLGACKKLVAVDPPVTAVTGSDAYSTDATAISVLTGVYSNMSSGNFISGAGVTSLSLLPGLSADELSLFSSVISAQYVEYYTNALNSSVAGYEYWKAFYPLIFTLNSAINGLQDSASGMTPAIRNQLLGESLFDKAFCYFYLVNLYGDVPVVSGTEYSTNRLSSRTPKSDVWAQIITDLKNAQSLLSPTYLDGTLLKTTIERVRPTRWAADALLARAYLYTKDWADAEIYSGNVIGNSALYHIPSLDSAFLKNNSEAIWQLQPVLTGKNTQDAPLFILPSTGPSYPSYPVYMNTKLINAFEVGDNRMVKWVGKVKVGATTYYYPYKYKAYLSTAPVTEYTMVLRLAEQYLIRAEAKAQQNNLSGALTDLNIVRARAGLAASTSISQADILKAIYHERQIELFTEWGHRWLDLKRTGMVDSVMNVVTPLKGGAWNTNWQWYPLPLTDLNADPKLAQNNGY